MVVQSVSLQSVPDLAKVVLVVEDDALQRSLLAEEFRDAGFEVIEAENAIEAIIFMESSVPVDLVCTDVRIPGEIDGLALARAVRFLRPGVKIMVVSGHLPTPPPVELQDAFFFKPYQLRSVVARAAELLSAGSAV